MKSDRIIQLVALSISLMCLVGTTLLVPKIDEQRLEEGLGFDLEASDNVPPHMAIAVTALGSFRGLAADALWYRLEMLKRDGEFYEADTTSRMITILQPRYPQVWAFMAWNMAYNISVETHTPDERWDWVNKGVRLLREEGIPYNPKSIRLYKELGWIFFHKIGQRSDDMHLYYKYRLAQEWDEVLGPMYEGRTTEQLLNAFYPTVMMSERYWVQNRVNLAIRNELRAVINDEDQDVEIRKMIYDMEEMTLTRFRERIPVLRESLLERKASLPGFDIEAFIDNLEALANNQFNQAMRGGEQSFLADFNGRDLASLSESDREILQLFANPDGRLPNLAPIIAILEKSDIALDRAGLRSLGRIIGVITRLMPAEELQRFLWTIEDPRQKNAQLQIYGLNETDIPAFDALMQIRFNTDPDPSTGAAGDDIFTPLITVLLPYWRAKVLSESYRMDPATMFILMQYYGPLDWRHPASHSIYWGHLGVQKTMQLLDSKRIDVVNTQRSIIHGLQDLYRYGTLILNPYARNPNDRVSYAPNFEFADAYETAVFRSKEVYETIMGARAGAMESFDAGHENFLVDVCVRAYLYGDIPLSRDYFERARDYFSDQIHNQGTTRYTGSLEDFVYHELDGELLSRHDAIRSAVSLLIERAYREGWGQSNVDKYENIMTLAKTWHEAYAREKNNIDANAGTGDRLALPPWNEMVDNIWINFLSSPRVPPEVRRAAFINADRELILRTWSRTRGPLRQQFPHWNIQDPEGWTPEATGEENLNVGGTTIRG